MTQCGCPPTPMRQAWLILSVASSLAKGMILPPSQRRSARSSISSQPQLVTLVPSQIRRRARAAPLKSAGGPPQGGAANDPEHRRLGCSQETPLGVCEVLVELPRELARVAEGWEEEHGPRFQELAARYRSTVALDCITATLVVAAPSAADADLAALCVRQRLRLMGEVAPAAAPLPRSQPPRPPRHPWGGRSGDRPNILWQAVTSEELRAHPLFVALPPPGEVALRAAEDCAKLRQDSWQWDVLHPGRLTTSKVTTTREERRQRRGTGAAECVPARAVSAPCCFMSSVAFFCCRHRCRRRCRRRRRCVRVYVCDAAGGGMPGILRARGGGAAARAQVPLGPRQGGLGLGSAPRASPLV